MVSFFYLGVIF